jgi:hypothetical protein
MTSQEATLKGHEISRPVVVWILVALVLLRVLLDVRAQVSALTVISSGTELSGYRLYATTMGLSLFRAVAMIMALVLIWRGVRAGLLLVLLMVMCELYSSIVTDMLGGPVDGSGLARRLGAYTVSLLPALLALWCYMSARGRSYFRNAL